MACGQITTLIVEQREIDTLDRSFIPRVSPRQVFPTLEQFGQGVVLDPVQRNFWKGEGTPP